MNDVDTYALHGWAMRGDEENCQKAIGARHAQLIQKPGFKLISRYDPNDYNTTTYKGTAAPEFSDGDIAILCDSGNCCFGARVKRSGEDFTCVIYID